MGSTRHLLVLTTAGFLAGSLSAACGPVAVESTSHNYGVETPGNPTTIFVNADGITIHHTTFTNATQNASTLCGGQFAPFDEAMAHGDDRQTVITDLLVRTRAFFGDLPIEWVAQRPPQGHYTMAVLGGTPQQCGLADGLGGLSPLDCDNANDDEVIFVFADAITDLDMLALVLAHETGHSLGLPHTLQPCDVMSNFYCSEGEKRFLDQNMEVAPDQRAHCGGFETSNSLEGLKNALGSGPATDGQITEPEAGGPGQPDAGGSPPPWTTSPSGCSYDSGIIPLPTPLLLLVTLLIMRRRYGADDRRR